MALRDVSPKQTNGAERIAKTFGLALIISSVINCAALVYLLVRSKDMIEDNWKMTYQNAMILFLSIYITIALFGAVLGLIMILYHEEKKVRGLISKLGLVSLTLTFGSTIPYIAVFKNWEFFGLMAAIIACVIVMNILLIYQIKEDD